MPATRPIEANTERQVIRVGSVSFLNAKPLIYGLDDDADLDLRLAVPSRLLEGLEDERFDIALLPVIDYQRLENLVLVPSGGIGCDGPTLTVRIFSKVPIGEIDSIACDTDSHTSVALARVVMAEHYGRRPRFIDLGEGAADAQLLIGDKVVCEEPAGFEHQLDLGHAWREMTGLPFVFAIWTARKGLDLRDLPERLITAREAGLRHVDELVTEFALPRGWPADIARQYLTEYLKFETGDAQLKAIAKFHELAAKHGVIGSPPRTLELYAVA